MISRVLYCIMEKMASYFQINALVFPPIIAPENIEFYILSLWKLTQITYELCGGRMFLFF